MNSLKEQKNHCQVIGLTRWHIKQKFMLMSHTFLFSHTVSSCSTGEYSGAFFFPLGATKCIERMLSKNKDREKTLIYSIFKNAY